MYKKQILNSTMILAFIALISLMTACDNSGVITPSSTSSYDDYSTSIFFVELPNFENELGTEASFDSKVTLPSIVPFCLSLNNDDMGNDDHGGKGKGHGKDGKDDKGIGHGNHGGKYMPHNPLGKIFRDLGLDSIQKENIKSIIALHRDCEVNAYTALKAARTPIIDAANVARQAILDSLKSGLLTRKQAGDALKVLNDSVKTQMDTDPAVRAALAQLKACWDTLLANIRAALTPDQQIKWDSFISHLPIRK